VQKNSDREISTQKRRTAPPRKLGKEKKGVRIDGNLKVEEHQRYKSTKAHPWGTGGNRNEEAENLKKNLTTFGRGIQEGNHPRTKKQQPGPKHPKRKQTKQ